MRCGCPHCEAYMIQSETEHQACVCPHCGYRCNACLGTNTVITREQLAQLKDVEWFTPNFESPISDEDVEE
ncbi:MAG: hypothetical protein IJ354_10355 [Clostridia bacterium]|nr:hypothetical protein [Clostridia bacterium]